MANTTSRRPLGPIWNLFHHFTFNRSPFRVLNMEKQGQTPRNFALCAKVAIAQVILAICCALKIGILRTAAWHKAVNNGRLGNLEPLALPAWGWHFQWCEGFRWRLGELESCRSGVMSHESNETFNVYDWNRLVCSEAFMKAKHPEEARRHVTWHHPDKNTFASALCCTCLK